MVVSNKWCMIDTLLIRTTNRKYNSCHLQLPKMNLKVIHLLQDLRNAFRRTFVRHFAWVQLTRRVALSLDDSWASCCLMSQWCVFLVCYCTVQVSCAVRSYWQSLPVVKSNFVTSFADHFVGLKCESVCMLCIRLLSYYYCLQCFDAVGWAAGRAPGL